MAARSIEVIQSATLREDVHAATLPSGLRVYFCPKKGFKKKYACYGAYYGSVDNDFVDAKGERSRVPDGIAHFLEHTLFENEDGNVSDLFEKNGAYNNAMTSFTTTSYLFSASDRFWENLDLLVDFVETPCFRKDRVDKERGIIEQEISSYDDQADWVSFRTALEGLFHEHPIRIDIAGTKETIAEIDVGLLERCYDAFYHPENMSLFVTGDLEPERLFDFVEEHSRASVDASPVVERFFPDEPARIEIPNQRFAMEIATPKVLLGFKEIGVPTHGRDYVWRELVSEMALEMLFGRGSDTFREVYEGGLALDDFSASYNASAGIGYTLIGADSTRPDDFVGDLRRRIEKLVKTGLNSDDFAREKRKFVGAFVRSFNSLEYLANYYPYYRAHGFDLFELIDLASEITEADLEQRIVELLDLDNSSLVIVDPKS